MQNYLGFQPIYKYFKNIANSNHILDWTSKGFRDESIKPPAASNNSLVPGVTHISTKLRIKFDGSCLKQEKVTFTHKLDVSIYIAYEINLWLFTVQILR